MAENIEIIFRLQNFDSIDIRREFFLRDYPENMIVVRQHCISKNFNVNFLIR